MAKELRDYMGTLIPGILMNAGREDSIITIENRLLDGSYSIQTIGESSSEVAIEFICEREALEVLQLSAIEKTPINVIYNDDNWTGIIRGNSLSYGYVLPNKYSIKTSILLAGGDE